MININNDNSKKKRKYVPGWLVRSSYCVLHNDESDHIDDGEHSEDGGVLEKVNTLGEAERQN